MIDVDDRGHEERTKILRALQIPYRVKRLIKADADMCNKFGRVEIKELKDWWQATNSNKRFWKQLYQHIISDKRPYCLVIYGNIDAAKKQLERYVKNITRAKIVEAIAEAMVRAAGINIVFFERERDAIYFTAKFLQYCEEGKWGLPKIAQLTLYQRKKLGRPTPEQLRVMTIWGVSKNVAENLVKKFGSVRGICLATRAQVATVNGVGEVTARKISTLK